MILNIYFQQGFWFLKVVQIHFCLRNNSVSCSRFVCGCMYVCEREIRFVETVAGIWFLWIDFTVVYKTLGTIDSEATESTFEYRVDIIEVFF